MHIVGLEEYRTCEIYSMTAEPVEAAAQTVHERCDAFLS